MTIITTVETSNEMLRVANDNKHLLSEGEIVLVKNSYGQRKYKKYLDELKLTV